MAKPKPPRWLTQAFADGVDEREWPDINAGNRGHAYPGALGACWLAQHDERRRPCSGRLERAHLIPRQRVENAMYALLPNHVVWLGPPPPDVLLTEESQGIPWAFSPAEFILLAAWDPRNAVIGCEGHHRRFDNHATPSLVIPRSALPAHAFEFANDWGLDTALNDRFPL